VSLARSNAERADGQVCADVDAASAETAAFAPVLARLEASLAVPYPERAQIVDEMAADLLAAYHQRRACGSDPETAQREALQGLGFGDEVRQALELVHAPTARRLLDHIPAALRSWLAAFASAAPLAAVVAFLCFEVPVNDFLSEGGGAVYFVLAFGSLGLLIELQRFFIWFVLRDHSSEALGRNTATPLFLSAATLLIGVLGLLLKYHRFLQRWNGEIEALRRGLREPLPALILACSLAMLTILLHGALSAGLRAWRVPSPPVT
jgi:hypothetical protein